MSSIINYRDKNWKQIKNMTEFMNCRDIQYNGKNTKDIYWNTNSSKNIYWNTNSNKNDCCNSKNIYWNTNSNKNDCCNSKNIDTSEYCCAKCHRFVGCFDSFVRTSCCGKKMCSKCKYCCAGCRQTVCYKHAQQHNKESKKCFEYMNDYLVRGGWLH